MTFNHLLIVPYGSRSHLRQLAQLSFNVLTIHPSVRITFFVTTNTKSLLDEEIRLLGDTFVRSVGERYKVEVAAAPEQAANSERERMKEVTESFPAFWKGLQEGDKGWNKLPCLVIFDFFLSGLGDVVRQEGVNTLAFMTTSTLIAHRLIGPASQGGTMEVIQKRFDKYKADGLSDNDAALKALRAIEGKILNFPDLPPMYDSPQALARDVGPDVVEFHNMMYNIWLKVQGAIFLSVPEIEGEGLKAISGWSGIPVFGVGPQLNENAWKRSEEFAPTEAEKEIFDFLDKAKVEHGDNSVVYISFGTVFWPIKRPEIVEWIVESLLEHEPAVPFLFATATKDGKISAELMEKITASGKGMVVDWCPQMRVLQHPAVGAFVTHCGSGSLSETIVAGVPMVTLPIGADQPAQAAFYTTKLKCGYDLRELKTGFEGLPIASDGFVVTGTEDAAKKELHETWDKLRGENGRAVRENVQRVRDIWHKSWTGGKSRKAVESFSQFFH